LRYEAILFDFDGVMVDSEPVNFECWQEIISTLGVHMDWQTSRDWYRRPLGFEAEIETPARKPAELCEDHDRLARARQRNGRG
jgi:beta-phosphoglucomutase-like phosphatase (HAD superfamily)